VGLFSRRGRTSSASGQLRYAFTTSSLAAANAAPGLAVAVALPSAAIPRSLRIAANANATVSLQIDNINLITVDAQPSGQPVEMPIPAGAFPVPVVSVATKLVNPATAGGQATISVGY
jgi:hypothetical protein